MHPSEHPEGESLPSAEIIPFRRPQPQELNQTPDLNTGTDSPTDDDDGGPSAA